MLVLKLNNDEGIIKKWIYILLMTLQISTVFLEVVWQLVWKVIDIVGIFVSIILLCENLKLI